MPTTNITTTGMITAKMGMFMSRSDWRNSTRNRVLKAFMGASYSEK